MKIVININESGVHWCVSQPGRTSEFGSIEKGGSLNMEIGLFTLLAAVVDDSEPGNEDEGPVGYIDRAIDAQLMGILADLDM